MRQIVPKPTAPRRRGFRWSGSALDDIVMVVGITVVGVAFMMGALDLWGTVHTRQVLQQAGQIVDRSIVASGCLTSAAQDQLDAFVTQNGLNPADMVVQAQTTETPYGSRMPTALLGYDFNIPNPFNGSTLFKTYTQVSIPSDQSLAVLGDGAATSGCATDLSSTFTGTTNYGSTGGTGSSGSGTAVTSLTFSASPNPVPSGTTVALSGVADVGSNPAPSGTVIDLALPNEALAVSVGSNGDWSTTWTAVSPGSYTLTASSGIASANVSLDITAAAPQTITWQVPGTVTIGQAFTIQATVTDTNGYPVPNGTAVTLSSTDSTDIPTVTLDTLNGVVSERINSGITQDVSSVTLTAASGSVTSQDTITVDPGAPQSVTITASPTTIVAGGSVTFSGQVEGPDNTPPAAGTPVTLASQTDTTDTFPSTTTSGSGAYSASATLTVAGSQQVTAQVTSNGSTITSTPTVVTVDPGPAAVLTQGSATPNPVEQGAVLTVSGVVTDAYGNPVGAGVPITLTGSALTQTASTTTGTHGAFSVTDTFDQAGTQSVTVNANGSPLSGGVLSVDVLPTGADTLTPSPSAPSMQAGGSTTVTWTLTDSQGNPVAGQTLSFALSPAVAGAVTPTSATTNANGQVAVTVGPLTATGQYTLTATATGLTNVTGTAAITVNPATATLTVLTPTITPTAVQSVADGGTITPVITGTVVDAYGNPVANTSVTVTGGWDSGTFSGTTNSQGQFAIALTPENVGGPYYPTIALNGGSGVTYRNTELDVVNALYGMTLVSTNGSASTPAGTPYNVLVTVYKYGAGAALPVPNAAVTFSVSGGDTGSAWGTPASPPTPSSPTSITLDTNSQGQATASVALMPNTGASTILAAWPQDNTSATLGVTVTANSPSTAYWATPNPDPQTAGQTFTFGGQLVDSSGFGLSNGQTVAVAFSNLPWVNTTTGYGNGVYGWFSGSMTPTIAGTNWLVIMNVNGVNYDQNSSEPSLPGATETIDPAAVQYFYPALSNNGGSSWMGGYSWTNWASPSQGPTNAFGTRSDPPTGGRTIAVAGFGVDQYGNQVSGAVATLTCTASNGGSCPSLPSTVAGGWESGAYISGSYQLTFVPQSSPYPAGVASSPETTTATWTEPGLRDWSVLAGNGLAVVDGWSNGTDALGNLPNENGADQLNFALQGLDENGNPFSGYTDNGTNAEPVLCIQATNGGSCPNGLGNALSAQVPLPTASNGTTGWSGLTQFRSGQYVLSIRAGAYGDAGGQNWTPDWYNTHVSFTVPWILSNFTGSSMPSGGPDGGTWSASSGVAIDSWNPLKWGASNYQTITSPDFTMPNTPVIVTLQGSLGSGNTTSYNTWYLEDPSDNNWAALGTSWNNSSGNEVAAMRAAAYGSNLTYALTHDFTNLTGVNTSATYQIELIPGANYYLAQVNGGGWHTINDYTTNGSAFVNAGDTLTLQEQEGGSQAVTNTIQLVEVDAAP